MKFSASIVWLVMAAVINPLCCCLGSLHGMESAENLPASHACCTPEQAPKESDSTGQHSSQECPHQLEKKATKIQASLDHAPLLTPILGLWLGLHEFVVYSQQTPISKAKFSTLVETANAPPGNHQLLCIYLI